MFATTDEKERIFSANRVAGRIDRPAPTPPDMRCASAVHDGLQAGKLNNNVGRTNE